MKPGVNLNYKEKNNFQFRFILMRIINMILTRQNFNNAEP